MTTPPDDPRADEGRAKHGMDLCLVTGVFCLLCAMIAAVSGWAWWTALLAVSGGFNLGFCHAERIVRRAALAAARSHEGM